MVRRLINMAEKKSELSIIYPQVKLVIRYNPEDLESPHTGAYRVIVVPRQFEWMS